MKDTKKDKREVILENARKMFSKYGYSKTTMDDIGEVVGMKKNSLYHYFSNKEDLFNEIIHHETENYFESLTIALNKEKKASDKIKMLVTKGLHSGRERSNFYNVTVTAKLDILNLVDESYEEFIKKMVAIVEDILKYGIKNNEFIKIDHKLLAMDIVTMINSIEYREYQQSRAEFLHEMDYEELDRKILNLLGYIIKGIQVN